LQPTTQVFSRRPATTEACEVCPPLEKTCVVGCKQLKVYEAGEYCEIGSQVIRFGDPVSIDGRKGLFLVGMHPIQEEMHILPL